MKMTHASRECILPAWMCVRVCLFVNIVLEHVCLSVWVWVCVLVMVSTHTNHVLIDLKKRNAVCIGVAHSGTPLTAKRCVRACARKCALQAWMSVCVRAGLWASHSIVLINLKIRNTVCIGVAHSGTSLTVRRLCVHEREIKRECQCVRALLVYVSITYHRSHQPQDTQCGRYRRRPQWDTTRSRWNVWIPPAWWTPPHPH